MALVQIDALTFGGDAVGRLDGKAVLVPDGAPGDTLRVRVLKENRSLIRAELIEIVEAGEARRQAACEHFPACGGCQWLHVDYATQRSGKQQIVSRALRAVSGGAEVSPMVASPEELHYRRRLRMQWRCDAGRVRLGYFRRRSKEVIDIERCPLLVEALNAALSRCRVALSRCAGGAGTLELLASDAGEVHAQIGVERGEAPSPDDLDAPLIGGMIHPSSGDATTFGSSTLTLFEEQGDALLASASVFTQANAAQDRSLRRLVASWAAAGGERLLELYCGVGNLTQPLARASSPRSIVAVESSAPASALLRRNIAAYGESVDAVEARAEDAILRLGGAGQRFDGLLLDPPRQGFAGLGESIGRIGARRVVYVSCDPMTLARDLEQMQRRGFQLDRISAFDFMPQTYHIEVVVALSRPRG